MTLLRTLRALGRKTARSLTPYAAAMLAMLFAYSDVLATFGMVVAVGAGTGETLQMHGVATGWSAVAAFPAGALAGFGTYRLWWYRACPDSRAIGDIFARWAQEIVATFEQQGR